MPYAPTAAQFFDCLDIVWFMECVLVSEYGKRNNVRKKRKMAVDDADKKRINHNAIVYVFAW